MDKSEKVKSIPGGPKINKVIAESEKSLPLTIGVKPPELQIPSVKASELTQREAVFKEVMKVLSEEKIVHSLNQAVKTLLNDQHIKKICAGLVVGFQSKRIPLKDTEANKAKLLDVKLLDLYVIGLINNWLRRDKRLNGTLNTKSNTNV